MTRDEIIRMAREAGAKTPRSIWPPTLAMSIDFKPEQLERFAALVAAAEREACAKVCDEYDGSWYAYRKGAQECAAAIRARGNS